MKRTPYTLILMALLLTSTANLSAELYKWRDYDGQVHYSQKKPTEHDYQVVNAPPPPSLIPPDPGQPDTGQKSDNSRKKSASSSGTDTSAEQKQCETARRNLKGLQTFSRVRYKNSSGESVVMSQEMKEAKIEESKKQVDFYCN